MDQLTTRPRLGGRTGAQASASGGRLHVHVHNREADDSGSVSLLAPNHEDQRVIDDIEEKEMDDSGRRVGPGERGTSP